MDATVEPGDAPHQHYIREDGMLRPADKVAVITWAASGQGEAEARLFVAVVIFNMNPPQPS